MVRYKVIEINWLWLLSVLCFDILQHVEFLACSDSLFGSGTPHSRWTSSYVASCEGPADIPGGTTGTWNNIAMFIPAIAPSRLAGCGIINCNYVLKVSLTFVPLQSVGTVWLFSLFVYCHVFCLLSYSKRSASELDNTVWTTYSVKEDSTGLDT